jgi:hypothetical protein
MNYKREDYKYMARLRIAAFQKIADRLGKIHPITIMMGGRSYGRHKFEQGPEKSLQKAIIEMASLDGAFDILNTWARNNDLAAQKIMLEEYPQGFAKNKRYE